MSAPETGPFAPGLLTGVVAGLRAIAGRPLLVLVAVDNPAQPTRPVVEMQGAMPAEYVAPFLRSIADAWDRRPPGCPLP